MRQTCATGTHVTVAQAIMQTVELLEETVGSLGSLADPQISAEVLQVLMASANIALALFTTSLSLGTGAETNGSLAVAVIGG